MKKRKLVITIFSCTGMFTLFFLILGTIVNFGCGKKSNFSNGEVKKLLSDSLQIAGTFAHGNIVEITTDGSYDFGTRQNVKPLYVNYGDAMAGSPDGRRTDNFWNAATVSLQTVIKNGSLTGALKKDFKLSSVGSFESFEFDTTKPLIEYKERYYFDILDPLYQNASGALNLKTDRWWKDKAPAGGKNDAYIGYQGAEGIGNVRIGVENVTGNSSAYYGVGVPANQWLCEEIIFQNSSAVNIKDGFIDHVRNNVLLNPTKRLFVTIDDKNPSKLRVKYFDQISNGNGSGVSEVPMYFGYICLDDEYKGVYIGNSSTLPACTKMVRLPQTAWSATSISVKVIESFVPASNAYVYIRTGYSTWIRTNGLKAIP